MVSKGRAREKSMQLPNVRLWQLINNSKICVRRVTKELGIFSCLDKNGNIWNLWGAVRIFKDPQTIKLYVSISAWFTKNKGKCLFGHNWWNIAIAIKLFIDCRLTVGSQWVLLSLEKGDRAKIIGIDLFFNTVACWTGVISKTHEVWISVTAFRKHLPLQHNHPRCNGFGFLMGHQLGTCLGAQMLLCKILFFVRINSWVFETHNIHESCRIL